jgi:hypothetical protein
MQTELEKFITSVLFIQIESNQVLQKISKFWFKWLTGQKLNEIGKNSYTIRLGLRKFREVLNHFLTCLKIINPSVHSIKVGFAL